MYEVGVGGPHAWIVRHGRLHDVVRRGQELTFSFEPDSGTHLPRPAHRSPASPNGSASCLSSSTAHIGRSRTATSRPNCWRRRPRNAASARSASLRPSSSTRGVAEYAAKFASLRRNSSSSRRRWKRRCSSCLSAFWTMPSRNSTRSSASSPGRRRDEPPWMPFSQSIQATMEWTGIAPSRWRLSYPSMVARRRRVDARLPSSDVASDWRFSGVPMPATMWSRLHTRYGDARAVRCWSNA